jgi:hypothetical protein
VRRVSFTSLVLAVVVTMGGCDRGGGEEAKPNPRPSNGSDTTTDPESLSGVPQGATLRLPRGQATATFEVTALDPPTHTYDVGIVAPASADVRVRIRTWYGQQLRVLDSTKDTESCHARLRVSVCHTFFPLLEAQRAGPWTVIVTKRSARPARVEVEVTFERP